MAISTNNVLFPRQPSRYYQKFIYGKTVIFYANDNANLIATGIPGYDPLFKVGPFMEKLLDVLPKVFQPGQEITLDEQMCPLRGRILGFVFA